MADRSTADDAAQTHRTLSRRRLTETALIAWTAATLRTPAAGAARRGYAGPAVTAGGSISVAIRPGVAPGTIELALSRGTVATGRTLSTQNLTPWQIDVEFSGPGGQFGATSLAPNDVWVLRIDRPGLARLSARREGDSTSVVIEFEVRA